MKKIDLVIPTRNRYAKLIDTLNSVPDADWLNIIIVCDGDDITYEMLKKWNGRKIDVRKTRIHVGSVFCRNWAIQGVEDGVIYGTDDITFEPNAIETAFETFNKNFSDDDGVIGFYQIESRFHPTGVALVGQKFLKRYPNKLLFFPGYYHFCCQEVYSLARRLDKFILDENAKLLHLHPQKYKKLIDETHEEARKYKERDFQLRNLRVELKLLWGDNG